MYCNCSTITRPKSFPFPIRRLPGVATGEHEDSHGRQCGGGRGKDKGATGTPRLTHGRLSAALMAVAPEPRYRPWRKVPLDMALQETAAAPARPHIEHTVFAVIAAVSLGHLLNDLMQSLIPAVYPLLKKELALSFGQIGLVTLVFQGTASILQPLVGLYTDRRPLPYAMAFGMASTLAGLVLLAHATSFVPVLAAVALIGLGSSIFHPESSRIARLAAGMRPGFAQSFFQVGGNVGSSLGPLLAAFIVLPHGQQSLQWFAGVALIRSQFPHYIPETKRHKL